METVPDTFSSLFWGYTVIFGLVVLYVGSLARRLSRLESKLNQRD